MYNRLVGLLIANKLKQYHCIRKKGKFFFASAHVQKRTQELKRVIFQERIAKAWYQFVTFQEPFINHYSKAISLPRKVLFLSFKKIYMFYLMQIIFKPLSNREKGFFYLFLIFVFHPYLYHK